MNAADGTWVTVRLHQQLYALPAGRVGEMLLLPAVVPIPTRPAWVRGVARVRDDVVIVGDLRVLLGMEPLVVEAHHLAELLVAREQDHHAWLDTLERSVRDGTRFALTTDPHQCAFGKWYDSFHTDHLLLASHLKRFDAPHQAIHALGARCIELVAAGRRAEAIQAIEGARFGLLKQLVDLFATARHLIDDDQREILVSLRGTAPHAGLCVDAIERVGAIPPAAVERVPGDIAAGSAVSGIARVDDTVVLLFDAAYLATQLAHVGVYERGVEA